MKTFIPFQRANIGPCMDVRTHNGYLYVIQNLNQYNGGRLCVLTPDFTLVGEFTGIGEARQIEISGNIAIVTARVDGLWIFDISNTVPVLLSHYQTLEYATGATLYANFALVSCRQYGVEIIDISDPAAPRHVGIIRIGEVQSACVCDGYLYGGCWGEMNVAVVDIHDIEHPRLATRIPLEGRGDGVMAWGNRLYAVTGQHRRGIRNHSDPLDPEYGKGNGLSVFDITDPTKPIQLHREEFGTCYNVYFDMWKPALCDDLILCSCSSLGVFAYDRETYELRFHLMLPVDPVTPVASSSNTIVQVGPVDTADPVTSFTAIGNTLYLCGGRSDLFAYDAQENPGELLRWDVEEYICAQKGSLCADSDNTLSLKQLYSPGNTSVLAICECDSIIAAACSSGGLSLLDCRTFAEISRLHTEGFCYDVKYACGYLAVAMADKGILLCRQEGHGVPIVSRITPPKTTQQLYLTADAHYLLATSGTSHCLLYDISDKEHPQLVTERSASQGPLYGDNFATGTLEDGTILLFWHRDGLVYTNPCKGDRAFHSIFYHKNQGFMGFGPETGCDTDGRHIFYNLGGGYCLLPMAENVVADILPVYRTEVSIRGKFTLCGSLLVAAERAEGIVTVTDISSLTTPRHIGTCTTNASVGKPVYIQDRILIPGGHQGLLELVL